MLFSVKIQLYASFCVIFAPFLPLNVVSSTSAPKVNSLSLPGVVMRIYERMDHLTARVDQLESNGNNDTLDVQEMMRHITRAISDSNGQIIKQFENLEKTIENIEENNLKKFEKIEQKLDILFHLLNATERGSDAERSDDVWSGVTSQCESMCRAKLTTWANHTGSQLRTKLTEMELCDSNEPKTVVNKCEPNPCLHGGRCEPTSTGSDYVCVCPKFRSGSRCETVECTVEKKCWRLKDTLYTVIEDSLSWAEAKDACESLGMTLAMPKDQETNRFLRDQLEPIYSAHHHLWLGLKRDAGGSGWFWVDGSGLGEYFGGSAYMKSVTGSWFGLLYLTGVSEMWSWSDATYQRYAVCEANLISH